MAQNLLETWNQQHQTNRTSNILLTEDFVALMCLEERIEYSESFWTHVYGALPCISFTRFTVMQLYQPFYQQTTCSLSLDLLAIINDIVHHIRQVFK